VIAVPECREYGSILLIDTDCVFACFLLFFSVSCIFHYSVLRVRFYNKYITGRHITARCVSWDTGILGQLTP